MYKVRLIIRNNRSNSGFSQEATKAFMENHIDGSVKVIDESVFMIEAEGKDKQINSFMDWCNNNPCGGSMTEFKLLSYKE